MAVTDKQLTLRVAEAKTKDVGRAIARIDPDNFKQISVEVGDVIEIQGKRKTVAKIMPAYIEDRGKSIIQIDGLTRGNAQVSLDEKVTIQKTSYSPANKIVLSPTTLMRAMGRERDARYIGTLLEGLPLRISRR